LKRLRLRIGVFDSVQHGVEIMRADGDVAKSNLYHGVLRRVVPLDLLAFRLLRLRIVSNQDAVA
jgi:hypothetical protein